MWQAATRAWLLWFGVGILMSDIRFESFIFNAVGLYALAFIFTFLWEHGTSVPARPTSKENV